MPITPVAAILYIFLLVPGLIFLVRRDEHRPTRTRSVFRETAIVVFASAICTSVTLGLLILVSAKWPSLVTSLVDFLKDPANIASIHPRATFVLALGFMTITSAVAWLGGSPGAHSLWTKLRGKLGSIERQPTGWHAALKANPGQELLVGVKLKSGAWIQGSYAHHSDSAQEDGDRSLVLQKPLSFQAKDTRKLVANDSFDRLVVHASEIEYLLSVNSTTAPEPAQPLPHDPEADN